MDPRAGLKSTVNLVHTGIRSLYRPARSQWLYQLMYPARIMQWIAVISNNNSLSKKPEERSCQQSGVMLTVTDIGACRIPLFLNCTAPFTQTLHCTLL